ncbi:MAG TPA: HAMP domain-containing sensor histidine kinase [Bryobacteraceae bacterium]|nr:HAMP domain-containing sensor histidine kinase [Bryobacteraceae bacterium]
MTKVYIAAVLLLGTAGIASADWHLQNPWEFLCLLVVAVLASVMKVRLPGIFGTLSVSYLFILLGICDLASGEAIAIGCGSALVQCLWHAKKRVQLVQVAFSTMNVGIAVTVSYAFYHWPLVQSLNYGMLIALLACSLLYFGMNTSGVAIVIALTEGKSIVRTWKDCYFWSFPFYLVAASVVWIVRSLDVRTQWLNVLVFFPVIYVIFRSYRMYMDNLEAGRKEIELANALQKRTIEALEAAREASSLRTRFLASISHELRTPLNGIVGFAELLYDGVLGPVSEEQRECLGDMLSCSNHLRMLISHVLDLAKIEAGKMAFTYESISLTDLVREVIDTLQAIAKSKQIEIVFQPNDRIDSVTADAGKLKQILYNYLSNALKFTAAGGFVKVAVRAEDRETFRIDVHDDGVGIAVADLPRLFSEFDQLGSSAKAKTGTGLGLAITKGLAEAQGGRVGVTSALGQGSTFFVVLPRFPKAVSEESAPAAAANPEQRSSEACIPEVRHA